MAIATNIKAIQATLPENVTLVAVSKNKTISDLMEAYEVNHAFW
jgi:uncharacterized pyridoxal phosphate-containing UPF0001 family protein